MAGTGIIRAHNREIKGRDRLKSDKSTPELNYEVIRSMQLALDNIPALYRQSIAETGMQAATNAIQLSLQSSLSEAARSIAKVTEGMTSRILESGLILADTLSRAQYAALSKLIIDTNVHLSQVVMTPMLESIKKCLQSVEIIRCADIMSDTLEKPIIDAADIAFIRTADLAKRMSEAISYPRGMKSSIAELNVSASKRLAKCDDMSYEPSSKSFIVEAEPTHRSTIGEMNVICAGAHVIETIAQEPDFVSESELTTFMSQLEDTRTAGITFPVGKKIYDALQCYGHCIGFDKSVYYHGRKREKTECPYTHQDMLRAPHGISGPGRFNWPGMGHYYFSDEKVGVVKEIHKHSSKQEVIQIAKIKPIKEIKMMDLSGTMKHGKKFLEFIRFPLKDMKAIAPREYLIPNFVSDCCKRLEIEGIKYYGGKDYSNYVSWHEGYFEFVKMESIEA